MGRVKELFFEQQEKLMLTKEDIDIIREESTGVKYDHGKSRMDLLDPTFLEGVGNVLGFGAKKYAAHNWRGGIDYSRIIASIYRHIGAINRGEDYDPESGLQHSYHLGCNAMFLSEMILNRKDLDDRYKNTK